MEKYLQDTFHHFSTKTCLVDTHLNCLTDAIPRWLHNMYLMLKMTKYFLQILPYLDMFQKLFILPCFSVTLSQETNWCKLQRQKTYMYLWTCAPSHDSCSLIRIFTWHILGRLWSEYWCAGLFESSFSVHARTYLLIKCFLSIQKYWYFSYFSMKTYIVGTH